MFDEDLFLEAIRLQAASGGDLQQILLDLGATREDLVSLSPMDGACGVLEDVPSEIIQLVSPGIARQERIVPFCLEGDVLHLATDVPLVGLPAYRDRMTELDNLLQRAVHLSLSDTQEVWFALARYYVSLS